MKRDRWDMRVNEAPSDLKQARSKRQSALSFATIFRYCYEANVLRPWLEVKILRYENSINAFIPT